MVGTITDLGGNVFLVVNPLVAQELMRGGNAGVVRELFVRGERVKLRAVIEAPSKGKPGPDTLPWTQGLNNTNNLRNHIIKRLVTRNGRVEMLVGLDGKQVPYAYYVHEGTPPHDIHPRGGKLLVFYWEKIDSMIALKVVHHPGTKPNRFLVRALDAAGGFGKHTVNAAGLVHQITHGF